MLTILFDGVAYGMLLFILAVGLAVTMGLMNFINLAHGAFAMAGGYITVLLMQRLDVPFLVCLPIAFVGTALLGGVLLAAQDTEGKPGLAWRLEDKRKDLSVSAERAGKQVTKTTRKMRTRAKRAAKKVQDQLS